MTIENMIKRLQDIASKNPGIPVTIWHESTNTFHDLETLDTSDPDIDQYTGRHLPEDNSNKMIVVVID